MPVARFGIGPVLELDAVERGRWIKNLQQKEIFKSVQDMLVLQVELMMKVNGGNDIDKNTTF